MSTAVVTDSTSDIPEDVAEQYGIQIIRNLMIIDGKSVEDGRGMSREEFYRLLPSLSKLPTTATASAGAYQNLYERLFREGARAILSIHPSQLLSGVINAAHAAAQLFGGRVFVMDSASVSLGLGFQVIEAAEQLRNGANLEGLVKHYDSLRQRSRLIAMLDTLDYVRRSGRVGWARSRLGNLLQIKPFIEIKAGLVHSLGEVRTRRKGIERMRQLLLEQGALDYLAIVHTNAEEDARQFLASFDLKLSHAPLIVNVTTVVGTHAGPNALGFAALTKG